jgi:hypothetical protein
MEWMKSQYGWGSWMITEVKPVEEETVASLGELKKVCGLV